MTPDLISPQQAQARAERASHGRKWIVHGQNYAGVHAALRRSQTVKPHDELHEVDLNAMRAIEGGAA